MDGVKKSQVIMEVSDQPFRILSIDGGGIRGVYAAHILRRIEEEFGVDFSKTFDLIAGTSTGSIIAAGLATGVPTDDITRYYIDHGSKVFGSKNFSLGGLLLSKYNKSPLQDTLFNVFGDMTLSAAKTRLVIPATDISNGTVHVFKSPYLDSFYRDKNVKIYKAIAASCSAPLFFDPELVHPYLLSDGGLWANNPALVAYTEATGKLGIPAEQIRLLSIGTGISKKYYSNSRRPVKASIHRAFQLVFS